MITLIDDIIEGINPWHFLWIGIILSEIFTLLMNTILSLVWWDYISMDLLWIGTIDAFVVALLVAFIIIYFVDRIKQTNIINEQLQLEIREKQEAEKKLQLAREELKQLVKNRTSELNNALANVKMLSGFLPICASCKSIRDDKGYWNKIEEYIQEHSEAEFSHGICPECTKRHYPFLSRNKIT